MCRRLFVTFLANKQRRFLSFSKPERLPTCNLRQATGGFRPEDYFLEITSITAEIDDFRPEDLFFFFLRSPVVPDIVSCDVPPNLTSFVSVPQVKKKLQRTGIGYL